jgi:hypothetical protein
VDLSSHWLAAGENETAGLSHGHQANQYETRTVLMALKRGGLAGLRRRHGKLFLIQVRYWKTSDSEPVWEDVNARRFFTEDRRKLKQKCYLRCLAFS